eukprot:g67676.t1
MAQAEEIRTETGPLDYDYTEKEVELCQENLQNHKACSPDKIKNEMLKSRPKKSRLSYSRYLRRGGCVGSHAATWSTFFRAFQPPVSSFRAFQPPAPSFRPCSHQLLLSGPLAPAPLLFGILATSSIFSGRAATSSRSFLAIQAPACASAGRGKPLKRTGSDLMLQGRITLLGR